MTSDVLAGGRYRIVRRLAQGGMGEVLLAEFPGDTTLAITKGYVVLKRVLSEAQNRAHQMAMLREEARISLRLLHENLVESFFLDEHEGDPILVMEFLAGRSHAQVLGLAKKTKEMVPIDVTLSLLRASACGLYFAHSLSDRGRPLGLIHRDVSPANIFITFDGRVKVIDFGVAKADDSEIRTTTGVLKGKLGYMSPEHAGGDVKLTPAADLWSLGVVMWESLCAERLFASSSPSETLRAISEKPIPPPTVLRPDVPKPVVDICMGLLDRDPDRRLGTGRRLVEAIDALPSAAALVRVDLGTFLGGRFPAEIAAGRDEAARCAHMRRKTPIPIGLVTGTATQAPNEGETPTIVMKSSAVASLSDERGGPATVKIIQRDPQEDAPTRRVPARGGMLAEPDSTPGAGSAGAPESIEVDLSTRTQRIADLPPLGVPIGEPNRRARSSQPSLPVPRPGGNTATKPNAATLRQASLLAVAMLTFGLLAVGMGVAFSYLAPTAAEPSTVFAYVDPAQGVTVVGQPDDVPAGVETLAVAINNPMLPGGPALSAEAASSLRARLHDAGVLSRASLPNDRRAIAASLLPLLICGVGALALALALPALLLRGRGVRTAVQVLFLACALGGLGWGFLMGGLGWPGRTVMETVPRLVVNAPVAPPS